MIKIIDVTVRDGLQSFKKVISHDKRSKIVNLISSLGISHLEVGSIVSNNLIPQMKESIEVYKLCNIYNNKNCYYMLASNYEGIKEMMINDVRHICFFTSPSDEFNKRNINRNTEDSFKRIEFLKSKISNNAYTRGYLSCITECPYEGEIPLNKIIKSIEKFDKMNVDDIALSDTLGTINYEKFKNILDNLNPEILKKISIHLHQSDDSWKKIVDLCLSYGINRFDTSILNLGGCPAAFSENKRKSGNLNLFDFITYLDENKIMHNVNKSEIRNVEKTVSKILNQE